MKVLRLQEMLVRIRQLKLRLVWTSIPKEVFAASVARYAGRYPTLTFSYWDLDFAHLCRHGSIFILEIEFAVKRHFQTARRNR